MLRQQVHALPRFVIHNLLVLARGDVVIETGIRQRDEFQGSLRRG